MLRYCQTNPGLAFHCQWRRGRVVRSEVGEEFAAGWRTGAEVGALRWHCGLEATAIMIEVTSRGIVGFETTLRFMFGADEARECADVQTPSTSLKIS